MKKLLFILFIVSPIAGFGQVLSYKGVNTDTIKKFKADSLYIKGPVSFNVAPPFITSMINSAFTASNGLTKVGNDVQQYGTKTSGVTYINNYDYSTVDTTGKRIVGIGWTAVDEKVSLSNISTNLPTIGQGPIIEIYPNYIETTVTGAPMVGKTRKDTIGEYYISPNETLLKTQSGNYQPTWSMVEGIVSDTALELHNQIILKANKSDTTSYIKTIYQSIRDTIKLHNQIQSLIPRFSNQVLQGDFLTWQHIRGTSELYGNTSYQQQGVGIQIPITTTTSFNEIKVSMGQGASTNVVNFRVYVSNSQIVAGFIPNSLTLLEAITYANQVKPFTQGALTTYNLSKTYTVSAGKYLVILIARDVTGTKISAPGAVAYFTSQSATPLRTAYFFSTNNVADDIYTVSWSLSSPPNFCAVSAELYLLNSLVFDPDMVVPDTLRGVADHEINLWKDAIVDYGYKDVFIDCISDSGYNKERCYRFTPKTADTTGKNIQVSVYDRNKNLIQRLNTRLKIYAKNNGSGNKNILCIGNSLMAVGTIPSEIDTMISIDGGITNTMIGTKGTGDDRHEGISGWRAYDFSIDRYSTVVNPFYFHTFTVTAANATVGDIYEAANGSRYIVKVTITGSTTLITQRDNATAASGTTGTLTKISGIGDATITYSNRVGAFNMKTYMSVNGFTDQLDFVCIQLGINDAAGGESSFIVANFINYLKTIVDYINHATTGYPNCKIILAIPPYGGNTIDGFTSNYGADFSWWLYRNNMKEIYKNIISSFWTTRYSTKVQLAIPYLMVDRFYGYPRSTVAVSSRNATTISEISNGVHPEVSGYLQIADAFYYVLRSQLR